MCENHVSGCQLPAVYVVNAHATLLHVKPCSTSGFSATYVPSSKLTNSWPSVCKYGRTANTTSAAQIHRETRLFVFAGRLIILDGAPWRRRTTFFLLAIVAFPFRAC